MRRDGAIDRGAPGAERAAYPETFFIDDKPLKPVDSLDKVVPGPFYFDYAAEKIDFQDDPAGHKVEAGVSPFAFRGPATGVTVENLVVEKYDSPTQYGAVGYDNSAKGWTVQNNEIKLNYGVGAYVGTDSKVVGNDAHDGNGYGLRTDIRAAFDRRGPDDRQRLARMLDPPVRRRCYDHARIVARTGLARQPQRFCP